MAAAIRSGNRSGVQAKTGIAETGELRRDVVVVARRAVIVEGQQARSSARPMTTIEAARLSISARLPPS